MSEVIHGQVWRLIPGKLIRTPAPTQQIGILITPENTSSDVTSGAWSSALRHTAAGLDLPDYDAAIAWMLERHPDWMVVRTNTFANLAYDPEAANRES